MHVAFQISSGEQQIEGHTQMFSVRRCWRGMVTYSNTNYDNNIIEEERLVDPWRYIDL